MKPIEERFWKLVGVGDPDSDSDFDVSAIAKAFGGGGQARAAGFFTDLETLKGWLK